MPVTEPVVTSAIIAAAPDLTGPSWYLLASAVGQAVSVWIKIPTSVSVSGVVTGTVSSGIVAGKLFIPPTPIPLPATVLAAGFSGPLSPRISSAIGIGVSTSLNASAFYSGSAIGAVGADVSKVIFADPISLTSLMVGAMASKGLVGPQSPILASGLANGIATMVLTGTGTGIAFGAAGPAPAVGTSKSKIV